MRIFKKKKRLEELELDCPDIKEGCAFKDSGLLSYCRNGEYVDCQYRQVKKREEKE